MMTRPYGSIGDRCDCCSVQAAETLLACRNFKFQGKPVFARDLGRWAVCCRCRELLWAHQWLRLSKCSRKNPELFRKLSRHIIPGENIHSREVEEQASKWVRIKAALTGDEERFSRKDDSVAWLESLYALPDLRMKALVNAV
jgi:hypothetical protein